MDIFEKFWLKKAALAQGIPAITDEKTVARVLEKTRETVAKLSDLFTTERPRDGKFRDYMSVPAQLAAYGLFFFPQSFARAEFALRRLFSVYERVPAAGTEPLRILDLGSGAAPCGFAAVKILSEIFPEREIVLTAFDRSSVALGAARELARSAVEAGIFSKNFSFSVHCGDLKNFLIKPKSVPFPSQDLILLGWSLNECVPAPADAVPFLKNLAPVLVETGSLVVLEPALKSTAERLQRASDFFATTGRGAPFFRLAPELGEHECPLLCEGVFWNHEVRSWQPPETLEFLNRTLFREISVLKFSWCALGKTRGKTFCVPAGAKELVRLVSPIEMTKTCLRFVGVNPRGEKISVEIPTRGLSKHEVKKIAASRERGDIVALRESDAGLQIVDFPA